MAAGITLAQAEAKLALWMAAEDALATSQSYEIEVEGNRRQLTRANLKEVSAMVDKWNSRVIALSGRSAGRSRTRNLVN